MDRSLARDGKDAQEAEIKKSRASWQASTRARSIVFAKLTIRSDRNLPGDDNHLLCGNFGVIKGFVAKTYQFEP